MHVTFVGKTNDNTTNVREHRHSNWEILYYISGTGTLLVGDRSIPFYPGKIVCQPPDIPHSEASEHGFYNIHIQVSDFVNPVADPVPHLTDTLHQDFLNIVTFLYREYHLKSKGWNILVDDLFQALYRYIALRSHASSKNSYIQSFEEVLVTHMSDPLFSIGEAQRQIPLSPYYLKRLFKQETGMTPIEYLNGKRIEHAKQLLEHRQESRMTIREISHLAGFQDSYYFSRLFRRLTGKCPSDWLHPDDVSENTAIETDEN